MQSHRLPKSPFPVRVLTLAFFILCAAPTAVVADEKPREDQLITMDVKNKPLGKVLEELQISTGISFSLNIEWKDIPVSVTLSRTPIDKGLKRILNNYNSVVIYNRKENSIQIRILGKVEPSAASKAPPGVVYRPEPPPEVVEEAEPPDAGTEETPADDAGVPGRRPKKTASETGEVATEEAHTSAGTTEETNGAEKETAEPGAGKGSEGGEAKTE
jgi:hypothetical protein